MNKKIIFLSLLGTLAFAEDQKTVIVPDSPELKSLIEERKKLSDEIKNFELDYQKKVLDENKAHQEKAKKQKDECDAIKEKKKKPACFTKLQEDEKAYKAERLSKKESHAKDYKSKKEKLLSVQTKINELRSKLVKNNN